MKYQERPARRQAGQSLVLLLVFVVMAMTLAITAIFMMIIGSGSITTMENGIEVRQIADSGVENALLKLVRNPSYTGETYQDGTANVEIAVAGTVITVTATSGDFTREVRVLVDYTSNVLGVTSWKEEF